MEKRIMQFKLLSYKQALRKANERNDKISAKNWTEDISTLQKQISEIK